MTATRKTTRKCSFEKCKRTGTTARSYYFCPEHWCQTKFYAINGSTRCEYLLRHGSHGTFNPYWAEINRELDMLAREIAEHSGMAVDLSDAEVVRPKLD